MVREVLTGWVWKDLGGSRRVLACLEDLVISVRVWEGPEGTEVCWRDHGPSQTLLDLWTLLDPHRPL